MAKRANSIQNLIDVEVWGDILLHDPKFLDDNNVITKAFLETEFDDFKEEIIDLLPVDLKSLIFNDTEVLELLRRALLKFVTTNTEVRGTLKDYLIELIINDIQVQNSIKGLTSWLILE